MKHVVQTVVINQSHPCTPLPVNLSAMSNMVVEIKKVAAILRLKSRVNSILENKRRANKIAHRLVDNTAAALLALSAPAFSCELL